MKLRKGDKVKVMSGKDKSKDGVIDRVYDKQGKVLVQGINLVKRHIKKNQEMPSGGIVDMPKAVPMSNLMLICPKCGKTTRVGFKSEKDLPAGRQGKKMRMCKKCKATFK